MIIRELNHLFECLEDLDVIGYYSKYTILILYILHSNLVDHETIIASPHTRDLVFSRSGMTLWKLTIWKTCIGATASNKGLRDARKVTLKYLRGWVDDSVDDVNDALIFIRMSIVHRGGMQKLLL